MPIVQMPDGTQVDMPDNPTADQLNQLRALQTPASTPAAAAPKSSGLLDQAWDALPDGLKVMAGGLVSGAAKAGSAIAGGLASLSPNPLNYMADTPEADKTDYAGPVKAATAFDKANLPQPQTPAQNILKKVGEGVGGSAILPMGGVAGTLAGGIGSGLGAGLAENAGLGPTGQIAASLLGGIGGSLATSPIRTISDLAHATLANQPTSATDLAIARMQAARQQGIQLNLDQAMGQPSAATQIAKTLANSRYGPQTQTTLNTQPTTIAAAVRNATDALPGETLPTQAADAAGQNAATGVLNKLEQYRQQAVGPYYQNMQPVPTQAVKTIQNNLRAQAAAMPNQPAAAAMNDLADKLFDSNAGRLITDPQQLDNLFQEAKGALAAPAGLGMPGMSSFQRGAATNAMSAEQNRLATNYNPSYATGRQVYQQLTDSTIAPMAAGPVGKVAGRLGAQDGMPPNQQLRALFNKGSTPGANGPSDITQFATEVNRVDPTAFPSLAKSWIADKIANAVPMSGAGAEQPSTAAAITNALRGSPNQNQGLTDILNGVEQSTGQTGITDGFHQLLDTIGLAARRPSISGMSPKELAEASAENAPAGLVKSFDVARPFRAVGEKFANYLSRDALKTMDTLFNTPEGVQTLQALAEHGAYSQPGLAGMRGMLGIMSTQDGDN